MLPDRVSNPGPLTYESGVLPIALRGPAQCLIIMHLLNRYCQYKAYKNDKSNFIFKRMLFAKFTQAHAVFGRGIGHLLWWLFL